MNPRLLGCSELCVLLCGVELVGLKPSDFVNIRLAWGSAFTCASAAASATMSTSTTTSTTSITALAAAVLTTAKLGSVAYIGRVLFQVVNEVSKQRQTRCEGLVIFPHGQYLKDHGLDCIVLDSSQQMTDLGLFVKAAVAMLHHILGNVVLLNMGISVSGPIPIFLLSMIGQAGKAGFHLVGKAVHMITAKIVGKQEMIRVAVPLLLGWGGMKPCGHLPKHFIQYVPYHHHVNAEGVAEGSVLLKQCNGCCRLTWKGSIILKDWCTSYCLGAQRVIVLRRVIIVVSSNEILVGYIGEQNACDSTAVLKLLNHNFKGLGKVREGGLDIAINFVLKGQLHMAPLAKCNYVLLDQCFEVNFARYTLVVLHSKYQ